MAKQCEPFIHDSNREDDHNDVGHACRWYANSSGDRLLDRQAHDGRTFCRSAILTHSGRSTSLVNMAFASATLSVVGYILEASCSLMPLMSTSRTSPNCECIIQLRRKFRASYLEVRAQSIDEVNDSAVRAAHHAELRLRGKVGLSQQVLQSNQHIFT